MTQTNEPETGAPVPTPAPISTDIPEVAETYDGSQPEPSEAIEAAPAPATAPAPAPTDDLPKDKPEDYRAFKLPDGPNPNVMQLDVWPFRKPAPGKEEDAFHITSLPCDVDGFNSLLEAYPSINYEIGEQSREWASEINLGSGLLMQGGFLSKAVNREGSMWGVRVPYGAGSLGIARPKLGGNSGPGAVVSGEMATMRVRAALGSGVPTMIPLFHTGIWVTLRAPSAAARLELQRRIDSEKIQLGRMTNGMAYSNVSTYVKGYLVDFALAHLSSSNMPYARPEDLKSVIDSNDIPTLIWGVLTTLYPNGYPYHQPCMNDPSACQHVVKEVVDINKIHFVDTQRLTESQLKHMSRRAERIDPKDVERYKAEFNYGGNKGLVELTNDVGTIKLQLKVPTIADYMSAGFHWVDGTVNAIQRAFGSELQGQRRNDLIVEAAKATSLCEYSHWVREIGLPDGSVIQDLDTIRQTLAELGGEPELAEKYFKEVTQFIEDATIALVALPRFDCPACGKPATTEQVKHPYLNPIDVESLFFTMLDQLIAKAIT